MRDEMEAFLLPTFPYLAFFRADTFFLLPGEGHPKVTGTHSTVEIGTPTKTNRRGGVWSGCFKLTFPRTIISGSWSRCNTASLHSVNTTRKDQRLALIMPLRETQISSPALPLPYLLPTLQGQGRVGCTCGSEEQTTSITLAAQGQRTDKLPKRGSCPLSPADGKTQRRRHRCRIFSGGAVGGNELCKEAIRVMSPCLLCLSVKEAAKFAAAAFARHPAVYETNKISRTQFPRWYRVTRQVAY